MRILVCLPICFIALCLTARAQQPPLPSLVLPGDRHKAEVPANAPGGPASAAPTLPPPSAGAGCDAANSGIYKTCREAAIAALRAGNDAANNVRPNRDRATGFYLLSIQRDPTYGRVLFNLGVMCVKSVPERWEEALSFYREASHLESSPDVADQLSKEITRVDAIWRLETTPDGRRQRKFDLDLNDLIAKFNDPAVAVSAAAKLMALDPARWEGPAARGILQAALSDYANSATSLDAAAHLAPTDVRAKLFSAAELAKNEAQYVSALKEGDTAFEKKDYENAGRLYADAWQASPGRVTTGMQAAVAFLMADRVSLAVEMLVKIHQLKSPELSEKAGGMLRELGAISSDAKVAADAPGSGEVEPVFDVAERIRTVIGDLRSPEMKLVTSSAPSVVGDDTKFLQLNDDELNHPKEEYVTTSESLFDIYLKRVADRRAAQPDATAPASPASVDNAPATTPAAPSSMPSRPQPFGSKPDPAPPVPPGLTLPAQH